MRDAIFLEELVGQVAASFEGEFLGQAERVVAVEEDVLDLGLSQSNCRSFGIGRPSYRRHPDDGCCLLLVGWWGGGAATLGDLGWHGGREGIRRDAEEYKKRQAGAAKATPATQAISLFEAPLTRYTDFC